MPSEVVKSLHDSPAISWKEKNIKEIEDNYESKKKKYSDELDRLRRDYDVRSKELKQKIEYAGAVLKNVSPDSFQTLVDVLTGNIKWVVVSGYTPELLPWDQFHTMYEDKFRLLSVYGRDNGSFTYAKGYYSDYSGGSTNFTPFNNYEDAFELFKQEVLKRGINDAAMALAKKYNILFPESEIVAFKAARIKVFESNIEKYKKEISAWEASIQNLNENPSSL